MFDDNSVITFHILHKNVCSGFILEPHGILILIGINNIIMYTY